MKKSLVLGPVSLVLALLGSACTHTRYTDPSGATFSRTTVLTSQQVGEVKVKAGEKELSIGTLATSQAETTGVLLGAALKAAR